MGRVNLVVLLTAFLVILFASGALAADGVRLVVDGQEVTASPRPFIAQDRTLVPVRLVSETLGAQVDWYPETQTVEITKENRKVRLYINNRLVDYGNNNFGVADVPAQLVSDRTFVPLRLVSNALGVAVSWDNSQRTVHVNSGQSAEVTPFYQISITGVTPGQTVTGTTEVGVKYNGEIVAGGAGVKFLLLDPDTGQGPVVARGKEVSDKYQWLPDAKYSGLRVLAAIVYDQDNRLLTAAVVPVKVAPAPQVSLQGVTEGETIAGQLALTTDLNFVAKYVEYSITKQTTGQVIETKIANPWGAYYWAPGLTDNGAVVITVTAYDHFGTPYQAQPIVAQVDVRQQLELRGVTAGAAVERPVTLYLKRNFPVTKVEYLAQNVTSGEMKVLASKEGYSSFRWFPEAKQQGTWKLFARVKDHAGETITTDTITVKVPGTPKLLLETVGPKQILTGPVQLKSATNVSLSKIDYYLINPRTGAERVIAGGDNGQARYTWTPGDGDEGAWGIRAEGITASGQVISSESIPVRVYLGKLYSSAPVIDKSRFKDFAARLAVASQEKTGMSAALQTAQAILETGWGQYTPVDKYTGQMSNNLFGIKGKGPAGSVTSNTWEEYNGNTFRVDAAFRAYQQPGQSWADHKNLLLKANRYQSFREVMFNSTRGAWALKQAGYATDSQYPIKLINIIKLYDLQLLDEQGI